MQWLLPLVVKTVYDGDKQISSVGCYVTVIVAPGSEDCL